MFLGDNTAPRMGVFALMIENGGFHLFQYYWQSLSEFYEISRVHGNGDCLFLCHLPGLHRSSVICTAFSVMSASSFFVLP